MSGLQTFKQSFLQSIAQTDLGAIYRWKLIVVCVVEILMIQHTCTCICRDIEYQYQYQYAITFWHDYEIKKSIYITVEILMIQHTCACICRDIEYQYQFALAKYMTIYNSHNQYVITFLTWLWNKNQYTLPILSLSYFTLSCTHRREYKNLRWQTLQF